jgi:hypothetical protein
MLGVVVVGGIYSPQQPSRWGRLLAMGAPDSPVRHRTGPIHYPVRRHITQPLWFGSSRPLAPLFLMAPDSPVPHRTGPVQCPVRL